MSIQAQVASARTGTDPALICRVPSGWVVLCQMQFLPGYCILMPDPVVDSLNALHPSKRAQYLCDMALVGDAVLEVTGAYRINYCIMGNSDPALHAHIVPRYLDEPDVQRTGLPWSYSQEHMQTRMFDAARDRDLILKLSQAIEARLIDEEDALTLRGLTPPPTGEESVGIANAG